MSSPGNPLPLIINPPHPPNNKCSRNMVYYNILGIFIIRGVGGFIIWGRGLSNPARQQTQQEMPVTVERPEVNWPVFSV